MRGPQRTGVDDATSSPLVLCDVCGSNEVVEVRNADHTEDFCQSCWEKRTNWDEGARSTALLAVGNAVKLALYWEVPEWAILAAVNITITEGDLHPDDALGLGALHPVDPDRRRVLTEDEKAALARGENPLG
jgi:hypothetical protein